MTIDYTNNYIVISRLIANTIEVLLRLLDDWLR